ncbi:MAG TPA: substrate-binding domain-containing protein [Bryobacteraceae bacterium]|nr:substrate-binding domain-containing protein [Bryobacteraceae bacterium]
MYDISMTGKPTPQIETNLAKLRLKRGFSAAALAKLVGVSRQTIYAMEAGNYVPNTAVALQLARALEARVEELFTLAEEAPAPELHTEQAVLLPGAEAPQPGQPVQLCRVDRRLMASAPSPVQWYFPASDAIVIDKPAQQGKAKVHLFQEGDEFRNRILVAGCDPGISVLARHVQAAGVEMVLAHRNSSQALELLREGSIHVAGTHLRDENTGDSNLPEIGRLFPKNAVAVVTFAVWEEGIVTARGNPQSIHGIEDMGRGNLVIVNREKGAGSRNLLDSHLKRLKIPPAKVQGYDRIAPGHLAAAWQVRSGAADACIATRAAARLFGLGFIPLVSERYDLAIRRQHLDLPPIRMLLDTLSRTTFRRELESLGGYDTRDAGQRML